jgi:SAM-dependent methyltransferase
MNYYDFRLRKLLVPLLNKGSRVLEVGAACSRWVPYFYSVLGCETWGIDYSEQGLELTRRSLPPRNTCRLVKGDFFDRSLLPTAYFDLIYSNGFIEHFADTVVVTRRIAELLRPGGKALTVVPNLTSLYGRLQKRIDEDLYKKHIVMDCVDVDRYHEDAGLAPVMPAQYYSCFAPGVVGFKALDTRFFGLGRLVMPTVKIIQHSVCWILHALRCDFESKQASPHIVGIYEREP